MASAHRAYNRRRFVGKLKKLHGNWNIYEKLLFAINLLVALAILIYAAISDAKDWTIWVAFIGNVFNILSVILATKKRVICFFWGILAVIAFGAISFQAKAFGNVILYWAFFIPSQIVAWVLWYRSSDNKIEIKPAKMKWWQVFVVFCVVAFCVCLFVDIETLSDFQKFWFGAANNNYILIRFILDSTILFASLAMTLFVWLRFRERWILSIIIDAIQTVFWILLATGNDQHPKGPNINSYWIMVASSLTMLIAAVYGAYNWWSQRKAK